MSTDRETTRIVRSWLRTDEHESADRILGTVLDRLDTTPQRRATGWRARRLPQMNTVAKLGLAAAVVAVALIGFSILRGQNIGGPQLADPTTTPTESAVTTPSTTPRPLPVGELDPGSYLVTREDWTPVPFSITVPAGWANNAAGFMTKHADEPAEVMLTPWLVTHIYADACQWDGTLFEVGTTADDLAAALAEQGAREVSGPIDVTLGGHPAKQIELSVPADLDAATCDDGGMRSWPSSATDETTGWIPRPGQTDVVYIIDVDGERILIGTTRGPEASDQDVRELEGVIASIRIISDPSGN
jgi:hypothetical protein